MRRITADPAGLDGLDRRRHADIGTPCTEDVGGDDRQRLVNLGQHARAASRAGFEEPEANLVAPDPRIEAQHVFDEGRELAEQFDADDARRRSRRSSGTRGVLSTARSRRRARTTR